MAIHPMFIHRKHQVHHATKAKLITEVGSRNSCVSQALFHLHKCAHG